jgi:hypothetical protein
MSAVTSVIAGFAAAAGAIVAYRFIERQMRMVNEALRTPRAKDHPPCTIEFERDPATGVFRAK